MNWLKFVDVMTTVDTTIIQLGFGSVDVRLHVFNFLMDVVPLKDNVQMYTFKNFNQNWLVDALVKPILLAMMKLGDHAFCRAQECRDLETFRLNDKNKKHQ